MAGKVTGRGADRAVDRHDLAGDQARGFQFGDPESDVEALLNGVEQVIADDLKHLLLSSSAIWLP